jgi:hypothetical protein
MSRLISGWHHTLAFYAPFLIFVVLILDPFFVNIGMYFARFIVFCAWIVSFEAADTNSGASKCSIEHNGKLYDLSPLKQPEIQGYHIPSDKYRFRLNVCASIAPRMNDSFKENVTCHMSEWEGSKEWICGREKSKLNIRDDFLELIYEKGDSCFSEMYVPRTVRILLICEPEMDRKAGVGAPVFISENRCTYIMAWKTWAACPVLNNTDGDHDRPKEPPISGWTVLVIILVVSVSVYFLLGIVYRTYVLREEGFDRIPNIQFWRHASEKIGTWSKKLYAMIKERLSSRSRRNSGGISLQNDAYESIPVDRSHPNSEDDHEGL